MENQDSLLMEGSPMERMWKLRYVRIGFAVVGITFNAAVCEAATYYVAQTGSDNNSCSQAAIQSSAKRTIRAGISCLVAGDTLTVKEGTYNEALSNPFSNTGTSWNNKITVKAESPRAVILKPNNAQDAMTFDSSSQKYIEFDGFEIDAVNVSNYGIRIWSNAHHIRFRNSAVLNAANQGVSILKDGGASPDFNEFINVEVAYTAWSRSCNGSSEGQKDGYCHGFYVSGSNNLLDGMLLHHNNGFGVQFYPQGNRNNTIRNSISHSNKGTGLASLGDDNKVINNVVYNNDGGGLLITESNCLVYNNTVYNNPSGWGGMNIQGSGHKVKNNLFYQNSVSGMSLDSTNLNGTNPQFVNSGTGNFRLQAGSPAIDRGTALTESNTDIVGTPRPQGASFDIGAYEFGESGADTTRPAAPSNLRVSNLDTSYETYPKNWERRS